MIKVVGIQFNSEGKLYYFDPAGLNIKKGDNLIVETSVGKEYVKASTGVKKVEKNEIVGKLKSVVRIATKEDTKINEENKKREKEASKIFETKVKKHGLDMSLVKTELTFDRSKYTFFFTSDGRVDFRELVKDLAGEFHMKIELRQVGVRDETRLIGGLGVCGRPYCCSTFLNDFQPVSIKMAKDQSLSLAPGKISGACNRLLCCLQYEQEAYEDLLKKTPNKGCCVRCSGGCGKVVDRSLLTGLLKIQLDDNPDGAPIVCAKEDVKVIKPKNSNPKKK